MTWSAILPGLREVRAPLIAGYIWLLAIWIAIQPALPEDEKKADDVLSELISLAHGVSPVGLAIAVGILAYFVGSVADGLIGSVRRRQSALGGLLYVPEVTDSGMRDLREVCNREAEALSVALSSQGGLSSALKNPPSRTDIPEVSKILTRSSSYVWRNIAGGPGSEPTEESDSIAYTALAIEEVLVGDLDLVRTRLLATEPEIHAQADRLEGEAELRFAVAVPLLALLGVFTARWALWWLFGILFVAVLWRQGRERSQQSGDVLIEAIRLGRATTPMLERIESERKQLLVAP